MLSGSSKKILLVDDNALVLEMMGRALANHGFECYKASSAMEGLNLLGKHLPDVILSDYEMPDMNGFQFREHILQNVTFKNIPFIFLTSHNDEQMMMKGLDLQALDYIFKDTPVAVIVSKIINLLQAVTEQHQKSVKELSAIAHTLNLRSVPVSAPAMPGFKADFWHQGYQGVPGGDFIDFITISPRYTCIVLGDVMGKKWGAWFFSFSFLSYIRGAVRLCVLDGNFSVAGILQKINRVVFHDPVLSDVLSTLSLLMVDHQEQSIDYSGAGDLPVLYYNSVNKTTSLLRSEGLLLGVFDDGQYTEHKLKLQPGDQLILITDGMIDFEDESGKVSDYDKFVEKAKTLLGLDNSFELLKQQVIIQKPKQQIDDCSIIFIQKEV